MSNGEDQDGWNGRRPEPTGRRRGPLRLRRVVLDTDELSAHFDIHPSVTVIVVHDELAARAAETLATATQLTPAGQTGVHVELDQAPDTARESGRYLLIFRPHGSYHRVIDVEADRELGPAQLQQLDWGGPPRGAGGASCRVDPDLVARLAAANQAELWRSADRLLPFLGADCLPGTSPLALADLGAKRRRGLRLRARRGRLGGDGAQAAVDWRKLAGDSPLPAALAARPAVEVLATIRARHSALAAVTPTRWSPTSPSGGPTVVADPLARVVTTLTTAPAGQPQVAVLPDGELRDVDLHLLLDQLAGIVAGHHQLLVVTSHPDVADWGRLESHAGRAATVTAGRPPVRVGERVGLAAQPLRPSWRSSADTSAWATTAAARGPLTVTGP